jgi:methyl-branched lipid omega-hydroxylase
MSPGPVPTPSTDLAIDDIDLGQGEFWDLPEDEKEGAFALLRRERPVSWHSEPPLDNTDIERGPGFWAVVRYADVMNVSRNPARFISGRGSNIPDWPPEVLEFLGSMINMDDPRHTKLRLIVNRGFTPHQIGELTQAVDDRARAIVDEVADRGECDFVLDIASRLPLDIICNMLGIPGEDHEFIFEKTNLVLGVGDPEVAPTLDIAFAAAHQLWDYAQSLGQARLDHPRDDITTKLMQAEVEGQRLTAAEFGSFFVLLTAAGNETTRNAISHGLLALTQNPQQRQVWLDDFEGVSTGAVEEIVRWATPVIHFRRTATRDTVVGGQEVKAGEKVVMFYNSANRDEREFDDPFRFDVRRTPNEHVGFGAGGPHFCLGANLARREIKVMFEELFRRLPDIEVSGEPAMLQSAFIHGIKRMPCRWTAPR